MRSLQSSECSQCYVYDDEAYARLHFWRGTSTSGQTTEEEKESAEDAPRSSSEMRGPECETLAREHGRTAVARLGKMGELYNSEFEASDSTSNASGMEVHVTALLIQVKWVTVFPLVLLVSSRRWMEVGPNACSSGIVVQT